jgi:hypothetical protein
MTSIEHDLLGKHLTAIHDIIPLLTATIALCSGCYGSDTAARTFCPVFGAIYLLLDIVGLITPNAIATIIRTHTVQGCAKIRSLRDLQTSDRIPTSGAG